MEVAMKKVIEWWRARKRIGMSELGLELLEAMEGDDVWVVSDYTMKHKASGIELWLSNGFDHFKVYAVPGLSLGDKQKEEMLNLTDRKVLWNAYKTMMSKYENSPAYTTLNILRLGRIKESGERQ
jgi:hypothetical protein